MKKSSFGYKLGMFLTALLGLSLGVMIFFWMALDRMDYVDLAAVHETNNASEQKIIAQYLAAAETQAKSKEDLKHIPLFIDSDCPIKYVPQKDKSVENILVFGVDSRGEKASRADSIILVTVNRHDNSIKLTSIMRDTEMGMNTVDGGRDKVNAAYAYGGIGMLINTLNANLDLDIQKFVMLDFWSSVRLVDALGGIEMDISETERLSANRTIPETARLVGQKPEDHLIQKSGTVHLDGIQAVSWARIRDIDSDFGRTSRQRILAQTMIKTFYDRNLLKKGAFAVDAIENLPTNIDKMSMVKLGFKALPALKTIQEYRVPQDDMYVTNQENWNMIFDSDVQIPDLHNFIWNQGNAKEN